MKDKDSAGHPLYPRNCENKYLVSKDKGCMLNAHQLEANNNQWNVKKTELISSTNTFYVCQGCQRFETSVFFSEKINISTTGGSRVGFFQPDTNHP